MIKLSRELRDSINIRWKIKDLIYKLIPDDYTEVQCGDSLRINPCPFSGSTKNALSIYTEPNGQDKYVLWSSNRTPQFEELPEFGSSATIVACIAKTEKEAIDICRGKAIIKVTPEKQVKEKVEEHISQGVLDILQEEYEFNLPEHIWFLTGIRRFSQNTIAHFRVGFDNKTKAYSYPYIVDGEIKHFKYKMKFKDRDFTSSLAHNSGGNYFFNEDALKDDIIMFVEGEHDVMMVYQRYGIECVGISGNFKEHSERFKKMKEIRNKTIFLAFDRDEAGERYTTMFKDNLDTSNKVYVLEYEGRGKDPDELIKNGGELIFPNII